MGIPAQQGKHTFTVTVTDAVGQTASATLTLDVVALAITTTALPTGTPTTPYSAVLAATGGVAPYKWTLVSGSLPAGITLTRDGLLTGTPTATALTTITVQVADSTSATARATFNLNIVLPSLGAVHLTELSNPIAPATQTPLTLALNHAPPVDLLGTLTLAFTPPQQGREDDATTLRRADGQGERKLSFKIPAGTTTAKFDGGSVQLQTGTLAGGLTLTAEIAPDGQTPITATSASSIAAAAPVIRSARVLHRDDYCIEIEVNGYSTTGEVATATFTFAGTGALPPPKALNGKALFDAWYLSEAGRRKGGSFKYVQKLNFTASTSDLTAATITLKNGVGPSQLFCLAR